MRRLVLGLVLLLTLWIAVASAETIRTLTPPDLQVMEQYLTHSGCIGVRVQSGTLELEGKLVYARLDCRSGQLAFVMVVPLGWMNRQEVFDGTK